MQAPACRDKFRLRLGIHHAGPLWCCDARDLMGGMGRPELARAQAGARVRRSTVPLHFDAALLEIWSAGYGPLERERISRCGASCGACAECMTAPHSGPYWTADSCVIRNRKLTIHYRLTPPWADAGRA